MILHNLYTRDQLETSVDVGLTVNILIRVLGYTEWHLFRLVYSLGCLLYFKCIFDPILVSKKLCSLYIDDLSWSFSLLQIVLGIVNSTTP